MLKARFLGTPRIEFGEDSFPLSITGRGLALFAYLCVTRQPASRSELADLLWHNQSEQKSKANLRYQLRDLRKVIGDYLVVDAQTVAFNQELPHWVDITSFATYLSPNLNTPSVAKELTILQELLNLYAGEFLAGFYIQDAPNFERWLLAQRRQFHDLMIYSLQLATQQHLERGDYAAGLELNQYLLAAEPWREEAHRQRMILLAATGQRSAALMQYEICCQMLEHELDAPPMDETTSLYSQIKSGMWFLEQKNTNAHHQQPVAVRAYPSPQNNAIHSPIQTVEPPRLAGHRDLGAMPEVRQLIGRQQEIEVLNAWLTDERRQLCVILGLGGQGKSALAASVLQGQHIYNANTHAQQISDSFKPNKLRHAQHRHSPSANHPRHVAELGDDATHIIWRSLAWRPSCIEIMQDWILPFSNLARRELSTNFDQLATMLFTILGQHRCLFVLDGVETVLQHNERESPTDAEAYEHLFRLFIERQHRGRLLVTSRVCPKALTYQPKQEDAICRLKLQGLSVEDSEALLAARGLTIDTLSNQQLYQQYAGSPQLLHKAADVIHDLFDGNVAAFMQEELYLLGDLGATLAAQFAHLSPLEVQMMQVLMETKQPLARQTLWKQLPSSVDKEAYYCALRKLLHTHVIEQKCEHFQLAPLPSVYLAERARKQN
ncbi:MAG: BTAD domain-containing putative transcriptional regulator [Caldilineaceae bacterium]